VQRNLLTATVVAFFTLAVAAQVNAGIISGDRVSMQLSGTVTPAGTLPGLVADHTSNSLFGSSAGEFLMTVNKNANGTSTGGNVGSKFITFCVEVGESIASSTNYQVIISSVADHGGPPTGQADPLSAGTQYLFQQYYISKLDTLPGSTFNYNDLTETSANELQEAIWFLEGEIGSTSGLATTLVNLAAPFNPTLNGSGQVIAPPTKFLNPLDGSVSVAQLYKDGDVVNGQLKAKTQYYEPTFYQDQLVWNPPPPNVTGTPEAASVITWCVLGLVSGGCYWRRRRV